MLSDRLLWKKREEKAFWDKKRLDNAVVETAAGIHKGLWMAERHLDSGEYSRITVLAQIDTRDMRGRWRIEVD